MKLSFVSAAVAAFIVIGCSDQSSLNAPVSEQSGVRTLAKAYTEGGFEVNETILDKSTGESYIVSGVINYEYTKGGEDFGFNAIPSLQVRNANEAKEEVMSFEQKNYHTGVLEATGALVQQDYQLSDIASDMILSIVYSVGDDVAVASMSISHYQGNPDDNR